MQITNSMPPQQIARILRQYCEDREIAESRFGRIAVNDPALIFQLRDGRRPRARTLDRINIALSGEV